MTIQRINPKTLAPPVGDMYTQVVIGHGPKRVFIAGQVAIGRDGHLVGRDDHEAQARQVWQNIKDAVQAVGGSGKDITRYGIYVVDHKPELVDVIFRAGTEVFGEEFPKAAGTLLGVQSLGLPDWLIEIEAEAILGPSTVAEPRRRAPEWWRLLNRVMIPISRIVGIKSIIPGKNPVILTVPGRNTGKPRSRMVTPLIVNGQRYVVAGFPGADWVKNVRAASEVTLQRGRRIERFRPVEISDDAAAREILREFPAQVGTGKFFFTKWGTVKDGSPAEFEAFSGQLPVFRFDPINPR